MSTKIVDDQDPSVEYSPGWAAVGTSNEFDNTAMQANVAGLTATLHFSGTGIKVFGTISGVGLGQTSPTSSYSVDGTIMGSFTGVEQTLTQYKILFFQSATLPDMNHTLIVTNTGNSTAFLFLDFFEITESTPPVTSTPTAGTSSSSPTSSSSGALSATVTMTSSSSSKGAQSPDTAIVGGVLGGLLVLGVLSFLLLHFRRNRKRDIKNASSPVLLPNSRRPALQPLLPPRQMTLITPFDLSQRIIEHRPSTDLLSQSPFNLSPSQLSQNGETQSHSVPSAGQSHATAQYEQPQAVRPTSDIVLTAMGDALPVAPPNHGTTAASEVDTPISARLADTTSSAQFDMTYDPPPRYGNDG